MAKALTFQQEVLSQLLDEYESEGYGSGSRDDAFELYVAAQILKPLNPSDDELTSGVVDGTADGGIDAFYTILDDAIIQDNDRLTDADTREGRKHPRLQVVIIQAKQTLKWSESVWDKLTSSLARLLDTRNSLESLRNDFRPALLERVRIYRELADGIKTRFPKVSFDVYYAAMGREDLISRSMNSKADHLTATLKPLLTPGAEINVKHLGAETLYGLAAASYSKPGVLKFKSSPIREPNSFVGIARISDYLEFVRDADGNLRQEMFEANVRDFEGKNFVNKSIAETLQTIDQVEFWWRNNGITVLGRTVDAPQDILTIEQPLIVNGLQTTYVLDKADREGRLAADRRDEGVVVRVIASDDERVRDTIVVGTNRQTRVPGPALYASDPIQLDIERFFLSDGWFYERRKNLYRNQGKPANRRVSIGLLAQAVISLELLQPDQARARPSSLLVRQKSYNSIFNRKMPIAAYLSAARLVARVSQFLRGAEAKVIFDDFLNGRFYLLVGAAIVAAEIDSSAHLRFAHNFTWVEPRVTDEVLIRTLKGLRQVSADYIAAHPNASPDTLFKSSSFREYFLENLPAAVSLMAS